jgi:hypothetical protein
LLTLKNQTQKVVKKLILAALSAICSVSLLAQGTVYFGNRIAGSVITHVYFGYPDLVGNGSNDYPPGTVNWAGYTPVIGSQCMAQLLAAPGSNQTEYSLQPASPTTTFRTTTVGAGWVNALTATLNNVPPDAPVATIEMVVWDNSSGLYPTWTQARAAWQAGLVFAGESGTFNLGPIGGLITPAPDLIGLQSFSFGVPEPATFALVAVGGAAMLVARRRG